MKVSARLDGIVQAIPVSGGVIAVEVRGEGEPIVLVHGWTLDRRVWKAQTETIPRRYQMIAYDRRGFGQSTVPPNLGSEVADLASIAEVLKLRRFKLIGMSQGARIALAFAVSHPGRVSALVLQGAPLSGIAHDLQAAESIPSDLMIELATSGELVALQTLWMDHPLMSCKTKTGQRLIREIVGQYAARDLRSSVTPLEITADDVVRITAPTLVTKGADESPWRHRVGLTLEQAIPNARRVVVQDAGHFSNIDQPQRYWALIEDFLKAMQNAFVLADCVRSTSRAARSEDLGSASGDCGS